MLSFANIRAADLAALLVEAATTRVHAHSVQVGDVILSGPSPFVVARIEDINDGVRRRRFTDTGGLAATYFRTATPTILRRDLVRPGMAELAAKELEDHEALKAALKTMDDEP
jgi:hypothetical protein